MIQLTNANKWKYCFIRWVDEIGDTRLSMLPWHKGIKWLVKSLLSQCPYQVVPFWKVKIH